MKEYHAPLWLRNGHLQSIYPTLFRKCDASIFARERIDTDDGDFLNLDWSSVGSDHLVIISHGLEGHSQRPYVVGMAQIVNDRGWDALAWNFRSCGGEMNRNLRFYHSGATDDLARVIEHARTKGYRSISLVGFSMGGNLTLVYLGQQKEDATQTESTPITSAVVFSVPCDLAASAEQLARPQNIVYMRRFLKDLKAKIRTKNRLFPNEISLAGYHELKNFQQFDDRYTAPIHGFRDAADYWYQCSSRRYIKDICVPTLIVNAKDDPFLAEACFPRDEVFNNPFVSLETPSSGGHVGFVYFKAQQYYWSELRAAGFIQQWQEASVPVF